MQPRLLCSILSLIVPAISRSFTEQIYQSIMKDYNKKLMPPVKDAINIIMNMPTMMLINVLENERLAQFIVADLKTWIDDRLQWNPESFGNQTSIVIPEDDVWLPSIVIYNTIEFKVLIIDEVRTVKVESCGRVTWNLPVTITTTCNLQIDVFPFDVQVCTIYATSPSYDDSQIHAVAGWTQNYYANAEWVALNTSIDVNTFDEFGITRFDVRYHIKIRRNFIYYIIVIVIPTFLLSVLTTAGIFTASGTTEIVGIGLTSLLALSVMLGIVAETLPKSNKLTLMGHYLLLSMLIAALSICCAVIISAMMERKKKFCESLPSRIWYAFVFAKQLYKLKEEREREKDEEWRSPERSVNGEILHSIYLQILEMNHEFTTILRKREKERRRNKIANEWHRIFHRIEILFVIFFQLVNIALLIAFISFISENSKIRKEIECTFTISNLNCRSMDSIEVNMDRLKEVHKEVQAFKACQKIGLVLDKTMNLLLKIITTDIDPVEMRFELESLSGQREVAWQHDRKSVTPLRKCMYGVSESIEIAVDWLVRREILKREQNRLMYREIKQEVREVEENNEIANEIPEEIPIETLEDDQKIQDHIESYQDQDTEELEIKDEIVMIDEEEVSEMRSDRSASVAKRRREDEDEDIQNSAKRTMSEEVKNKLDNEPDDEFENMITTLKEEPL
ncbi:hypothetical protein PRIPAC_74471 [Pristionchus pacificus]|uniref:Transmembrane ion channel n=1 Tax=Pristionchus pacificus TaxID=54126 RepID=A0A2A6CZU6_PRIPA|nr:hypothetical protein PRIPAC_74471 [Pristionchus pacificus]|eukprot:PDM83669.1 transmembrane ion channel [Pristionchus pacificus]